jgi:hypothetical protein
MPTSRFRKPEIRGTQRLGGKSRQRLGADHAPVGEAEQRLVDDRRFGAL